MAPTCVWLSAKLEEQSRHTRQVLAVFDRLQKRREGAPLTLLDFNGREYVDKKSWLIKYERHLLKAFGFITHVDHPHKFVLSVLGQTLSMDEKSPLFQESWNLVNDSLRTTLCVRYKSETIGCGLIFLAARRLKIPLPENPPWWEIYSVKLQDIYRVCHAMLELYAQPKATYVELKGDRHQVKPSTPIHNASPDSHQLQDGCSPRQLSTALDAANTQPTTAPPSPPGTQEVTQPPEDVPAAATNGTAPDAQERHRDRRERDRDGDRHRSRSRHTEKGRERGSERGAGADDRQRDADDASDRPDRKRHRERDDGDRERESRRVRSREREKDEGGDREARKVRSRSRERDLDEPRNQRVHDEDAERDGRSSRHRERDAREGQGGRPQHKRDERGRREDKGRGRDREERSERVLSDKKRPRERARDYDPTPSGRDDDRDSSHPTRDRNYEGAEGEYRESDVEQQQGPLPPPPPVPRAREWDGEPEEDDPPRKRSERPAEDRPPQQASPAAGERPAEEGMRTHDEAFYIEERPRRQSTPPALGYGEDRAARRPTPVRDDGAMPPGFSMPGDVPSD